MPRVAPAACTANPPERTAVSGTKYAPSECVRSYAAAASIASRVLPIPPGPSRGSTRQPGSASAAASALAKAGRMALSERWMKWYWLVVRKRGRRTLAIGRSPKNKPRRRCWSSRCPLLSAATPGSKRVWKWSIASLRWVMGPCRAAVRPRQTSTPSATRRPGVVGSARIRCTCRPSSRRTSDGIPCPSNTRPCPGPDS